MTKYLFLAGLYICISRSGIDDPCTFSTPEEGVGHVAYGDGILDISRQASDSCERAHGETCETFCFESRGEANE